MEKNQRLKNSQPLVSVIVVNYNGRSHLEECFGSLLKTDYPKKKMELIMVDNSSSDDSVGFVKSSFPSVKVIINKVNNYCQSNNLAIRRSKAKYVALLNNDTKVDKSWLKELVRVIEPDNSIAAVGSKLLLSDGRIQNAGHIELPDFYWEERGFGEDKAKFSKEEEVASLCGAAVLYRREAILRAGLFDEDFVMYMEDVDMAFRLKKKGKRIIFVPQSLVYHKFHGSGGEGLSRFYIERNRLLFIAKYDPERLKDSLLGRGHFTASKGEAFLGGLYGVLPEIIIKLIKEHGLAKSRELLIALAKGIESVANYENNILVKEAGKLKQEIENALVQYKDKEVELSRLLSELAASKEDISRFQEELSLVKDALLQAESKLAETSKELSEEKTEASKVQAQLQQSREELLQMKSELSNFASELTSVKDSLSCSQEELSLVKNTLSQTESRLTVANKELSEAKTEISRNREQLKQSKDESDILKEELSLLKPELTASKEEILRSQAELSLVKEDLSKAKYSFAKAHDELKQSKEENTRLNCDLEKANSVLVKTIEELQGIYSSDGFRLILRPLWSFLWQIKLILKSIPLCAKYLAAIPLSIVNLIMLPIFAIDALLWSVLKYIIKPQKPAKFSDGSLGNGLTVVIPNYNGMHYLEKCLESIFRLKEFQGQDNEVIVVDDASSDGSSDYIKQNFPQVKVISNPKNLGFGGSCNKGIKAASNERVVLLNNDIIVSEDFLWTLVEHLKDEDVFAVSPKLYAWDRKTFATGMYVGEFKNGYVNIWNESGVNAEPKINRAAPQMFAIGCAVCFRKKEFLGMGGFDEIYRPYCWEDIDISYQALKRGKRILYEPKSLAFHKIHGTIGDFKRRIEIKNELLFTWKNITDPDLVLKHLLFSPFHFINKQEKVADLFTGYIMALMQFPKVFLRRISSRRYWLVGDKEIFAKTEDFFSYYKNYNGNSNKKNLLLLTPFLPYPLKSGGQVKMFNTISRLCKKYNIILLSFIEREEQKKDAEELKKLCSRVEVVLRRPKGHLRFRKLSLPVFIKYFYVEEMQKKLLELINEYAIDLVQVEYMNMSYYAKLISGPPKVLVEHDTSIYSLADSYDKPAFGRLSLVFDWLNRRNYQKNIYRYFERIIAFTEEDAKVVSRACPKEKVSIIPIAVNSESYAAGDANKKSIDILFVGHMLHFPNEDGLKFFANEIFPLVRKELPNVNFKIIGSNMKDIRFDLESKDGIEVIGEVDDVLPYLSKAKVMVVPIRLGAGIKVKILESMAAGVAVVATEKAARGLKATEGKDIYTAGSPLEFVKKIIILLKDEKKRMELIKNGRKLIKDYYDSGRIEALEDDFYRHIMPGSTKIGGEPNGPRIAACWDILLRCNYRCPYCFSHGKWEELELRNRAYTQKDWLTFWEMMRDKYGQMSIVISGGEPFIYPDFLRLLKRLTQIHLVEVCTNLFFDVNKITGDFSPQKLILHPSFHPYFANLEEFIEKLKVLKSAGWELGPIIVAYPPLLNKMAYFKKRFKENGIDVFIQPFVGRYQDKDYPQSYTSEERENLSSLVDKDLTKYQLQNLNPKGALCAAGSSYFRVHPDGSISRCAAAKRELGRIEDKGFKLLGRASACESEFCICNSEAVYLQDFGKTAGT